MTATLAVNHLYGEISANSRLPIMWTLDQKLSFTFTVQDGGQTTVQVEGMGTQPSPRGLQLYEAAMQHSKRDGTKCVDSSDCIAAEQKAAGKYLSDKWKSIKKQDGKITRILMTSYDKSTMYYAVRSQGKTKWGEIFYSMIIASPNRIPAFVFKDGHVYATKEVPTAPDYLKYNLPTKSALNGEKSLKGLTGTSKTIALKYARSSINFARMMAYGLGEEERKMYDKLKVGAGDVDAIVNLFTWCAGTKGNEFPDCTGSTPGRIGWGPSPKQ